MKLVLPYGKGRVSADLPDDWKTEKIGTKNLPVLQDREASIVKALDNPVGTVRFDDIFRQKKDVAVIVPDVTRKSGLSSILPVVLNRLESLSIEDKKISIIFATGIHPPQTDRQKKTAVGEAVYNRYHCEDHDCNGDMGERGSLRINRRVSLADGILVIGAVKLHYLAGYGGARKAILPGISSYQQCVDFHRLCLDPNGNRRHPKIGQGILDGNPMHERAMEAASAVGIDFLINTVVDDNDDFLFINGGDLEKSFGEACRFVADYSIVPVTGRADIVIASCGGYPADINFIQSHKSLDAAARAVKPGGVIFLLSECSEGFGNSDFPEWLGKGSADDMYRALRENFVINGQTAAATKEKTESCRVVILTSMPEEDSMKMGMTPVKSFREGVGLCAELAGGKDIRTIVMSRASATLPAPETEA